MTITPSTLATYVPQQLALSSLLSTVVSLAVARTTSEQGVELDVLDCSIEEPKDTQHGEFATTVVMAVWGQLQKKEHNPFQNPRQFAGDVVKNIQHVLKNEYTSAAKYIEKIEIAGPGFINFHVSNEYLLQQLQNVHSDIQKIVQGTHVREEKVMIEFTDPNPFKVLHIGHLYSNTVGESIARLLETTGAQVQRVCYQGDVGMHVAKSIWGMRALLSGSESDTSFAAELEHLKSSSLEGRVTFLGKAYALGSTQYEEDAAAASEMKQMNFAVFVAAQQMLVDQTGWQPQVDYSAMADLQPEFIAQVSELYLLGRSWSLEYFNSVYSRVGMQFDNFYFESVVGEYGLKIVRQYLKEGVFIESTGAVIYPGSESGLHDRVFVNSLGLPTYEAKELGLAPTKYTDFPYDMSIIITGNEIDEYFKVLLQAMSKTHPDLAAKTIHLSHGMVRLPEGKMSSRTGKVLTAEWLLNESRDRIAGIMAENQAHRGQQHAVIDQEIVAEKVGQAAIKYAFLKQAIGGNIAFSFSESLSFSGQSGPYVQYSYARCASILRKAAVQLPEGSTIDEYLSIVSNTSMPFDLDEIEKEVLLNSSKYIDIIKKSVEQLAPHTLAQYLFALSQSFSALYDAHMIVADGWRPLQLSKSHNQDRVPLSDTDKRLLITHAVATILAHGCNLLGIEVVETM